MKSSSFLVTENSLARVSPLHTKPFDIARGRVSYLPFHTKRHSGKLFVSRKSSSCRRFVVCYAGRHESVEKRKGVLSLPEDATVHSSLPDAIDCKSLLGRRLGFKNRFLIFIQMGSVINSAAESFFKSEIRRRLFITAVLIVISRVGYFIPLPGFDWRMTPNDYLSFVAGSVGEFLLQL